MVPTWNCSQQAHVHYLVSPGHGFCKETLMSVFWPHFFPSVHRLTKAPPHPSTSRTCSPAATTVSGCVLSGSARTPPSWAAPTAPQWPSHRSEMKWRWAAARPAPGPGPAPSPTEPEEAWQTSSALSSSSWFSPSSPFSSLLSSSTLSLNEQFAPPSCRVIALFFPPPFLCCFVFFVLYFIVFRCQQSNRIRHVEAQWEEGLVIESWIEVKNWKTFFGTCDTFLTLLPLSPCPNFVVSVVQFQISVPSWSASCANRTQNEQGCGLFWGEGLGGKGRFDSCTCWLQYINIYIYMCIEIVIIYISIGVSSMKLFLIDVFQKNSM